jgi:ATP-binding cassette subfamily B protein/subfamily B ATP-binding cassette protein MsbA
MSRVVNDARQIEILIAHAIPDLATSALILILVTVSLFTINWTLALLTLIPIPFVAVASLLFRSRVMVLFRKSQEILGDLNAVLQDNLSGMKEIQVFAQEEKESARVRRENDRYSAINIKAQFYNGIFHPTVEFFSSLGVVIVVGFGGWLAVQGRLDVADIIGFILYLSLFYQPVATLARLTEDMQVAFAGARRIFEVLDTESDITEASDAKTIEKMPRRNRIR